MQKDLAGKVVQALLATGTKLDDVGSLVAQIDDETERRRFLRSVGETMATLNADLLMPIVQQYPDLDPDK
jgi:hypothetical protein